MTIEVDLCAEGIIRFVISKLDRREFLKLAWLSPFSLGLGRVIEPSNKSSETPNFIIIVFDALSALNMSLYGYPRDTTPNINRLADRATVYHNHFAAGNFTTPGTASLLTGIYPWTHRAINTYGTVNDTMVDRNLFNRFGDYYRISYSHNMYVNKLQAQFSDDLDLYKPRGDLEFGKSIWIPRVFKNDEDIATLSWLRGMNVDFSRGTYSLFLSPLFQRLQEKTNQRIQESFPLGLPAAILGNQFFLVEDAVAWLIDFLPHSPKPFIGYFHFLPPHAPYHTRSDFFERFKDDGWQSVDKPTHEISKIGKKRATENPILQRRQYDEFILYIDSEFNRLYNALERSGILENTWIILTSDHGEMFERGVIGHITPSLHQPLVRVPLLIFEPGQVSRIDIFENTNSVDILPTLLHLSGHAIPDWIEGSVLPNYLNVDSVSRSVFALEAKSSKPYKKLNTLSGMIVNGDYKLTYYKGYKDLGDGHSLIEMYNVKEDPEELDEISNLYPSIAAQLLDELTGRIEIADEYFT
jgi:arylsulfatase A-like enzyme